MNIRIRVLVIRMPISKIGTHSDWLNYDPPSYYSLDVRTLQ